MSVNAILQGQSYTRIEEDALLSTKQNTLTFDTTPIASSSNPVTSGGVASALDTKMTKGVDYVTAGQLAGATLGIKATAEGYNTIASGDNSHAEGVASSAFGNDSHTEGQKAVAFGDHSHAEGYFAAAIGFAAHAEGRTGSVPSSSYSITFTGLGPTATIPTNYRCQFPTVNISAVQSYLRPGGILINNNNEGRFITGVSTVTVSNEQASIDITLNEAFSSTISAVTLRNGGANGDSSHTEGAHTAANGINSHAEGYLTSALGDYSHAEGYLTSALGDYSHAEGQRTSAQGTNSHAEGVHTTALGNNQHVFGVNNSPSLGYVEIVGNGDSVTQSNARTLDWNGNEWLAGNLNANKVTVRATPTVNTDVSTKKYVDDKFSEIPDATSASTFPPKMNGATATGTITTSFARPDHVHPSDTSKSDVNHQHNATDINSGVLSVARGGTGITTNPSMLVNLNATTEAGIFASAPRPGVTGTLPVNRGGTGTNTFTSGALLIGNGTGAVGTRAITNNTTDTAAGTGTNIPTMNTLFRTLAQINGSNQTHATTIYAPTSAGTSGYILQSSGTGAPTWLQKLPITYGGTGATTAAGARANLEAAATSHTHDAASITSGTLPVNRGGTGANYHYLNGVILGGNTKTTDSDNYSTTALKSAQAKNGALYATGTNATPSFGILPAAQGGTGNTSLQATRNAMGLGNTTGALPVANGGTGATTTVSARSNLNAAIMNRSNYLGSAGYLYSSSGSTLGTWETNNISRYNTWSYIRLNLTSLSSDGYMRYQTGLDPTSSSYYGRTYTFSIRYGISTSNNSTSVDSTASMTFTINSSGQIVFNGTTYSAGNVVWSTINSTYGLKLGVHGSTSSTQRIFVYVGLASKTTTYYLCIRGAKLELGTESSVVDNAGKLYNSLNDTNDTLSVSKGGTGIHYHYKNGIILGGAESLNSTQTFYSASQLHSIRSIAGALYATASDTVPTFGTLPVAYGGTGRTTFSAGFLMGKSDTANEIVQGASDAPTDCNACTMSGIWRMTKLVANRPSGWDSGTGTLLVLTYGSTSLTQLCFNNYTNKVHIRFYYGTENPEWTDWMPLFAR